jgi:hypothetical protein
LSWTWATLTLGAALPFVVWPLLRHWQPRSAAGSAENLEDRRLGELEEIESDLAAGRLSEMEAALRRRELP